MKEKTRCSPLYLSLTAKYCHKNEKILNEIRDNDLKENMNEYFKSFNFVNPSPDDVILNCRKGNRGSLFLFYKLNYSMIQI